MSLLKNQPAELLAPAPQEARPGWVVVEMEGKLLLLLLLLAAAAVILQPAGNGSSSSSRYSI
jgi:hypothetical protein